MDDFAYVYDIKEEPSNYSRETIEHEGTGSRKWSKSMCVRTLSETIAQDTSNEIIATKRGFIFVVKSILKILSITKYVGLLLFALTLILLFIVFKN